MARTTDNPRTAIVNMRVPPADKAAWQRAARRSGMTLTEWLCALATRSARRK